MRWLPLFVCLPVFAQAQSSEIDVSAQAGWVDTMLDVRAGDVVNLTATGQVKVPQAVGPDGASRGWRDLLKSYPVNSLGQGALIGRIGTNDTAVPFAIGATKRLEVPRAGRLYMGINKTQSDSVTGTFAVMIDFASRGPEVGALPKDLKLPEITTAMIDQVPRRVTDAEGNAGDNTNFVIVGAEQKVVQALTAAGWVKVDRDVKGAILAGVLASMSKQAYLTLPMSQLTLFGRVQDYGFAHAEPVAVVAQRHHFRLWKAPFTADGEEVWIGAGTHDIGFERDQRNNGVTHKIDPDVDTERDYIGQTLEETGLAAKLSYVTPSQPNKEARTATGGTFHSDGRMLVIHLIPDHAATASSGTAAGFAETFCSVQEKENPDGGTWSSCDQYLANAPKNRVDLDLVPTTYRVLIVPGFFSSCASDSAPAFGEGVTHLETEHAVSVETWIPPNASSEDNAAGLAAYIREHTQDDPRKYILVGYSKGAPDAQVALATQPGVKEAVAAFVSVAGAIGGSAIADVLPAQAETWVKRFKMGKCDGDVAAAFRSLKRDVRRAFLAKYPQPVVPSYSIPASSDASNTSKALAESWKLLSSFGPRQDSQLLYDDAIIPGSKVLGTARADHWAVALPFDKAQDATIRSMVDKGQYPRAALLESIVRYVAADLQQK